jgi:hypothetical protein
LVVGVLSQCHVLDIGPFGVHGIGQSGITGFAGGVFWTLAGRIARLHMAHDQRHVQS